MTGPRISAIDPRKSSLASLRLIPGLIFALVLALSPYPAFAQHGGGGGHSGGGGGGHVGGGGHASGGSHGGASAGSAAPRGGAPAGYGGGNSSATSSRFIGGNNTWQAPPAAFRSTAPPSQHWVSMDEAASSSARVTNAPAEPKGMRGPLSASTALRSPFLGSRSIPAPPHIPRFPPRRTQPIFFYGGVGGACVYGYYPGFCGAGFYGFGYGWACDPFWGCPPGYYGYYNGGAYGSTIYGETGGDNSYDNAPSNEFNPSRYAYPPEEAPANGSQAAAAAPEVVLFLKDGTVYAIDDYWVAGGKLHYVTNYGGENSIDLDQIDMQQTVDVNAKRGINITLRPAPTPAPQDP